MWIAPIPKGEGIILIQKKQLKFKQSNKVYEWNQKLIEVKSTVEIKSHTASHKKSEKKKNKNEPLPISTVENEIRMNHFP